MKISPKLAGCLFFLLFSIFPFYFTPLYPSQDSFSILLFNKSLPYYASTILLPLKKIDVLVLRSYFPTIFLISRQKSVIISSAILDYILLNHHYLILTINLFYIFKSVIYKKLVISMISSIENNFEK